MPRPDVKSLLDPDAILRAEFAYAYYPEITPAFRWRTETIPAPGRAGTISFDLSVLVALIDSLAVGAGALFAGVSFSLAALAGAAFFVAQAWLYFRLLTAR